MGTQVKTIGRVPQNRGQWILGENYYKQNIVYNNGSSFTATIDNPSTEPTVSIVDGEIVVSTGWLLHAYGDLDTKSDVESIKNGEIVPPYAGTLKSWAERSKVEVSDEWDAVPVRTTAGSLSVDTAEGAHLISVKAKNSFTASKFSASPFNLLKEGQVIGSTSQQIPYILVPACSFGTFGTADENNGILVTDSNGNNKNTITMFFKNYTNGVPTSPAEGIQCPYHDENGYRFFLPPAPGYLWSSDMTLDDCAHIAWSKDYDRYEELSSYSEIDLDRIMTYFSHIGTEYYMLGIGGKSDSFIYSGSGRFTYEKVCGYDNTAWTNTPILDESGEISGYHHEKTISEMLVDSVVRDYAEQVQITTNGKNVSYDDSNETSSVAVVYELATHSTGSYTLANSYQPNDMGCEYLEGMSGDAIVVTTYMQEIPDSIYGLLGKRNIDMEVIAYALLKMHEEISNLKSFITGYGLIAKLKSVDALDYKVNGFPMYLKASTSGAPNANIIPDNWDEDKYGVWCGVPYAPNMFYIDIPGKGVYFAPKCTNSTADWIKF